MRTPSLADPPGKGEEQYEEEFEDLLHFKTLEDAESASWRLDELMRNSARKASTPLWSVCSMWRGSASDGQR